MRLSVMISIALSAATFMPGCGSGQPNVSTDSQASDPACAAVSGRTYESIEQYECGLSPDGPVLCSWTISFTDDMFQWRYSDVGESGTYSCSEGVITAMATADRRYRGELDSSGELLTWEGVAYQAQPAQP